MQVTETYSGYEVSFDYHPAKVQAIKGIPGRYFNAGKKCWVIPKANYAELVSVLARFGVSVSTADMRPEEVGELPPMPEPTEELIQFCKDNLKLQPYHYQLQGIQQGLNFNRFINGDEPGLGKTLQSIVPVMFTNKFPCLVICPATLKENWRREWSEKFTNKRSAIMTDSIKKTWHVYLQSGLIDVFITNYESLKKMFVEKINTPKGKKMKLNDIEFRKFIAMFESVIVDESHKVKDGSTAQSKFCMGIAKGKQMIIELTGTPIVNKPKDLIAQLHVIGRLGYFGGYSKFNNRYCAGDRGVSNMNELHYNLHKICFFRRNKKDVLKDLPDRVRQVVSCEITNREEYNHAKNEFVRYLKEVKNKTDTEVATALRGEIMVRMGILKGISARGKLEEVYEWVDELIESGEKVILFCTLRHIGDQILNRYNEKCLAIRGGMSTDERQMSIDLFQNCAVCGVHHEDHDGKDHPYQNNEKQVMLCSIKAASTGTTLTASSRVGFIEFPWHDADCDQCESRAHRNGQKDSVQCVYFLGHKTIDEYCYELIKSKRRIGQAVTGSADVPEELVDNLLSLFNQAD